MGTYHFQQSGAWKANNNTSGLAIPCQNGLWKSHVPSFLREIPVIWISYPCVTCTSLFPTQKNMTVETEAHASLWWFSKPENKNKRPKWKLNDWRVFWGCPRRVILLWRTCLPLMESLWLQEPPTNELFSYTKMQGKSTLSLGVEIWDIFSFMFKEIVCAPNQPISSYKDKTSYPFIKVKKP